MAERQLPEISVYVDSVESEWGVDSELYVDRDSNDEQRKERRITGIARLSMRVVLLDDTKGRRWLGLKEFNETVERVVSMIRNVNWTEKADQ